MMCEEQIGDSPSKSSRSRAFRVDQPFGKRTCLFFTLLVISIEKSVAALKFCVIADVPYNDQQARIIDDQIRKKIPADCAFVLHLGDYRKAAGAICTEAEFQRAANILKKSPVPVYPLLGDNDSVDCPNYPEGLQLWKDSFDNFVVTNWPSAPALDITYQPGRDPKTTFVIKMGDTLIFGLTILGASTPDVVANGLQEQLTWVKPIILDHVAALATQNKVGRIIIACQAKPGTSTAPDFFNPFATFVNDELDNGTPVLLLHGDTHIWAYEPNYQGLTSYLRVNIAGEAIEPPTIITVDESGNNDPTNVAFRFDRQIPSCKFLLFFQGVQISKFLFGKFCITVCEPWWQIKVSNFGYFVGSCPS